MVKLRTEKLVTTTLTEFQRFFLETVNENSGGIKFTELLTEYLEKFRDFTMDPEKLLQEIRDTPGLNILEYGFDMGEVTRVKYFIYTK